MIRNVTFEETTYAEPPAKFEAGTPNVADAVGLGAALGLRQPAGPARTSPSTSTNCCNTPPSGSRGINGLRLIGTAREKVGVLSFVLRGPADRRGGQALGPGRDRRSGRPSLRAAVAAAFRAGGHRPAVAVALQHARGDRPPGRRGQADSANLNRTGRRTTCGNAWHASRQHSRAENGFRHDPCEKRGSHATADRWCAITGRPEQAGARRLVRGLRR